MIEIIKENIKIDEISCFISFLTLLVAIISAILLYFQIKTSRETENKPLLRLVEIEEGFKENDYVDYLINDNKTIGEDKCYTLYFKNEGNGIARDIQIYSLNRGNTSMKQFKTVSRQRIIGDVEIDSKCLTGINIRIVKSDINDLTNMNFFIIYRNVYRDISYGILNIHDNGNNVGGIFFNNESNGYNSLVNSLLVKKSLDDLIRKSNDKDNSNWIFKRSG